MATRGNFSPQVAKLGTLAGVPTLRQPTASHTPATMAESASSPTTERKIKNREAAAKSKENKRKAMGEAAFLQEKRDAAMRLRKRQKERAEAEAAAAAAATAAAAQQAAEQQAPQPQPLDLVAQLKGLADLHAAGALELWEFQAAKAQLLGTAAAPPVAEPTAEPTLDSYSSDEDVTLYELVQEARARAQHPAPGAPAQPAAAPPPSLAAGDEGAGTPPRAPHPPSRSPPPPAPPAPSPPMPTLADGVVLISDALGVSSARNLLASDMLKLREAIDDPRSTDYLLCALRRLSFCELTPELSRLTGLDGAVRGLAGHADPQVRDVSARLVCTWTLQLAGAQEAQRQLNRHGPKPKGTGAATCRACQGAHRRHTCC